MAVMLNGHAEVVIEVSWAGRAAESRLQARRESFAAWWSCPALPVTPITVPANCCRLHRAQSFKGLMRVVNANDPAVAWQSPHLLGEG